MSNSNINLSFCLKPSRLENGWIMICHLLALTSIVMSFLPQLAKFGLGSLILLSCLVSIRTLRLRQQVLFQINSNPKTGWFIKTGQENSHFVEILPGTWISTWLILLHYQLHQRSYLRPIFYDALDKEAFRRLRVYLRISAVAVR